MNWKRLPILENVSNRNNEFLCSLWDEPMQSELNETLPKWIEIKIKFILVLSANTLTRIHTESARKGAKKM